MENNFCQSCGMPLSSPQVYGTESSGDVNEDYCIYCYSKGSFTSDCTMDEMIEQCADMVDEYNKDAEVKLTREQAVEQMKKFFPELKRWK